MGNNVVRRKQIKAEVSQADLDKIKSQYAKTTCRSLAEYVRKIVLREALTFYHRNQSLDDCMQEMMELRQELHLIAVNFDLAVQKLHSLQSCSQIGNWILFQESRQKQLLEKIQLIQEKIDQISDQWLQ
jgi:hypothetical protein